jgi:hypothetical protein
MHKCKVPYQITIVYVNRLFVSKRFLPNIKPPKALNKSESRDLNNVIGHFGKEYWAPTLNICDVRMRDNHARTHCVA